MDELLETTKKKETDIVLATVTSVSSTGIKIKIDGNDAAGEKEYKCNSAQVFTVGDRVKITENSGTYIIDYRVGTPGETVLLPSGGSDGNVLVKDGSTNYKVKWSSQAAEISSLTNNYYTLELDGYGVLAEASPQRPIQLGTQNYPFSGLYVQGTIYLGTTTTSKIGFFGHSPINRQTIANNASVATLITELKNYGLFA